MKNFDRWATAVLAIGVSFGVLYGASMTHPDMSHPKAMHTAFGSSEDLVFAEDLWKKLQKRGFTDTHGNLYLGGPPHGKVREVNEGVIDGRLVIVKNNYGGKNVSLEKVRNNPGKYLKAVTVMVKRPGYDPEDRDWFWIKYAPDGTVMANKKGMKLAGRVAKGKPIGCISCHRSASGNDFVFSHNKTVNAAVTWIGKDRERMMTLEKMMNP